MSFRITPQDVGRKAVTRSGVIVLVSKNGDPKFEYMTQYGACLSSGLIYYSDGTSKHDLVSWADEPATDQVADQYRPKDLRDEVAMVALQGMVPTEGYRIAHKDTKPIIEEMATVAYLIADAMLKARGK